MYLKIAHRGASGYERENTLRAFEKAIELGADMIELDIHLSREGIPVVCHDITVGGQSLSELTIPEIHTLDAEIPTLEDAIECVKGRCGLYLELKGKDTPEAVVGQIQRHRIRDHVIVASFDPTKVRRAKELMPDLETAILFSDRETDFVELAKEAQADCVHLCWECYPQPHRLLTDELLRRAAVNNLRVVIWHEERPEEIEKIVQKPIYGICSNLPDLLTNGG